MALRAKLSTVKFRISEIHEAALAVSADPSSARLFAIRYRQLDKCMENYNELFLKDIGLIMDNDQLEAQHASRRLVDSMYCESVDIYEQLFPPDSPCDKPVDLTTRSTKVRLPKLELPKFNGDYHQWLSFKDSFDSLIHNNTNLTEIDKFQYLVASLVNEPLEFVQGFPLTQANYSPAYNALTGRYQNKRLLAFTYWEEICNLSPNPKLPSDLRRLIDTFTKNLTALTSLGLPVKEWDFVLFHALLTKLDVNNREEFERQTKSKEIPKFDSLKSFIELQCQAIELSRPTGTSIAFDRQTSAGHARRPVTSQKPVRPSSTFVATTDTSNPCVLCNEKHRLISCTIFRDKPVSTRYDIAKHNNLCLNCLMSGHSLSRCMSRNRCQTCGAQHHTLLHFKQNNLKSSTSTTVSSTYRPTTACPPIIPSTSSSEAHVLASVLPGSQSCVLLSTASISVLDSQGQYQTIRVLLDSASQVNVITERCVHRLGINSSRAWLPIRGLNNQVGSTSSAVVSCTIRGRVQLTRPLKLEAYVIPTICANMPSSAVDSTSWDHLRGLSLADPSYQTPGAIDMLLGTDIFANIVLSGRITGGPDTPVALNTKFGWILMGRAACKISTPVSTFCLSLEQSLEESVKRFWKIEQLPDVTPITPEDEKCETIFVNSHARNDKGRYIVELPFRHSIPSFNGSREVALRRFHAIERRLLRDPSLYTEYNNFLREYLDAGHMEPVSKPSNDLNTYYIPHHCVVKPDSVSTKLRVVFDASAKTPSGQSLNDCLYTGAKLQTDIVSILLNFRLHSFVFTADVRQMYRQIVVSPQHRNYQRILWRFAPSDLVSDFRLSTVTYGVAAAPFLALRTIRQLVQDEGAQFPTAAKTLLSDVYVDDVVTGCASIEEALSLQSDLVTLLGKGGFELRKWATNHPSLLQNLDSSHCLQHTQSFDDDESTIKILGLRWHPAKDAFLYNVQPMSNECTKRSLLSEVARIFDPLGFLTPLTLFIKRLIQQLWALGCDWDQSPPKTIRDLWHQYKDELPCLTDFQIPRRVSVDKLISCQLHGFCDASELGYAAALYVRVIDSAQQIKTFLLCARSKVAPLKRLSIPRLELCAAVLVTDLIQFVKTIYKDKFAFEQVFAWTDSTVTLAWIQSHPSRWKTFVCNRVSHIQDTVQGSRWFHVRSQDNPADCASRGMMPTELLNHPLWWSGPAWLSCNQTAWPAPCSENVSLFPMEEERTQPLSLLLSLDYIDNFLNRFSSLSKIKRIIAYGLRFIHNCRFPSSKRSGYIIESELTASLFVIVKLVQGQVFEEDINRVSRGHLASKPLRKLTPFIDTVGLFRVGGRLSHSDLPYSSVHPILLPRQHRLTELIIEDTHRQHLHPGLDTLRHLLLQNFWILSARRAISNSISKCLRCFRAKPSTYQAMMGDLPHHRVNQLRAFQCVGVDFGGPFITTHYRGRGAKTQKSYLCLFVCFSTKAVHLEIVSSLSAEAFIAALRRFVGRRGRITRIQSDCGTNFVGSKRLLLDLMYQAASQEAIEFVFNPPSSPHFGGLWEAGIKSVKTHIARVVGDQSLTYEELHTLFIQIEAVLNSRPLCSISSDPNDLSVLTPGHFLLLEPVGTVPDPDLTGLNIQRLNRWQLIQRLNQDFWKRWHQEYLHTLMQRAKWTGESDNIVIGTVVLVKDERLPTLQWRLGRIVSLHPGPDGIVRVVTINTSSGLTKRPIHKLCPLPSQ